MQTFKSALIFFSFLTFMILSMPVRSAEPVKFAATLPKTKPLTIMEPLDKVMVSGINKFAERELDASVNRRKTRWNWDYQSHKAYAKSVAENRERFARNLGVVDLRVKNPRFEVLIYHKNRFPAGSSNEYVIERVRIPVFRGVTCEGLLLNPQGKGAVKARVIAIPDADWTPEQFCGLDSSNKSVPSHIARKLAREGCQVFIPTLINRQNTHSGHPEVAYTNQPHREFIYRMAFEMGRHIIGYEVQKVLAAVDAFELLNQREKSDLPIGVLGVGEGGLLAFHSAAIDPRIDAAMVCGYFQERERVWQEPIYRNVWALLTEFGDAELASLIAPRPLVIEASAVPEIAGPPQPKPGQRGGAAPGQIAIAKLGSVQREVQRAKQHYEQLKVPNKLSLSVSGNGRGPAGSRAALKLFCAGLNIKPERLDQEPGLLKSYLQKNPPPLFDPVKRHERQFRELMRDVQSLLRVSDKVRAKVWAKANRKSVADWVKTAEFYRNHVWEEMIGKLPDPQVPMNVRTRKIIETPRYKGYEVVLDVYPDVIAAGILLLPTDLMQGEKRPVVVCQHGLEGTPMDTITETDRGFRYYKAFAVRLAERGFITYAPQNPYRGRDDFRVIQRKSNPLKRSLFSYIIPQHQRTLRWLASLPYVDSSRIAFYGLSYGGKTAVRVPPMLPPRKDSPGYCLSICSADFNEWVKKNVSNEDRYSYIFTGEYEMFEWNMGHTANYAELSWLMTPRPFMVERGHNDGVAPDEWVAWEYAKVRRHYVQLGLADKTTIEFFNGPHSINGKGTFEFLHRHLNWPVRTTSGKP
ncbi:MAG: hypothetical protein Tsb009_32450 [Planctomycetaceae bacterium]